MGSHLASGKKSELVNSERHEELLLKGLTADAADPILLVSETLVGVCGALWRPLREPWGALWARRVTLGGPWGVPGCLWGVPGRSLERPGRALGVPGEALGGRQGVAGGLWVSPEASRERFLSTCDAS